MTRNWTPILEQVKARSPKIIWDNGLRRKKYNATELVGEQLEAVSINYAEIMEGFQNLNMHEDLVIGRFVNQGQQRRSFVLAYGPERSTPDMNFSFSLYCFHKLSSLQIEHLKESNSEAYWTWRFFYLRFSEWWGELAKTWKGGKMAKLIKSHHSYEEEIIANPSSELILHFLFDSQYLTLQTVSRSSYERFICLENEKKEKYILSHYVKGFSWLQTWRITHYAFSYFIQGIIKNGSLKSFNLIQDEVQDWNIWTRQNTFFRSLF